MQNDPLMSCKVDHGHLHGRVGRPPVPCSEDHDHIGASTHEWAGYTALFFIAAVLVGIGVIIGSWTTTSIVANDMPLLLPGEWCVVQE